MRNLVWKGHNCDTCPVSLKAYVFIRLRNDDDYGDAEMRGSSVAHRLRWDNMKSGGDIVAYAVDEGKS